MEYRTFEPGEAPSIPDYENFDACGGVPSPARLYSLAIADGSVVWDVELPWSRFSDPVVDEYGVVYVVGSGWGERSSVIAIDHAGLPRWQTTLNATPNGHDVTATQDTVFVTARLEDEGGDSDLVIALDRRSGELRWSQAISGAAVRLGGMVAWDDLVIVSDHSGQMSAFDQTTGERRWHLDLGGNPDEFLVIDGVTLYAVFRPNLIRIDAWTGTIEWEVSHPEADGRIVSAWGVANGVVVAVTENDATDESGFLVAGFSPDSGTLLWEVPSSDYLALSNNVLLTDEGSGEDSRRRRIRAWSVVDGTQVWRSDNRHNLRHSIADDTSVILVSFNDLEDGPTMVTSAEPETGQRLWTRTLDESATTTPLLTAEWVLVATASGTSEPGGTLTTLRRDDGELVWEAEVSDLVEGTPTILQDTIVALASHQPPVCF